MFHAAANHGPAHVIAPNAEPQPDHLLLFGRKRFQNPRSLVANVRFDHRIDLFPQAYQKPVIMTAAIAVQSQDAESAKALVKFLTSAKAAPAIKAAGMKPASKY
jgi:hypothetical protein